MKIPRPRRRTAVAGILCLSATAGTAIAIAASTDVGPNSATEPYVLPVAKGVRVTSLLTVSDANSASDGYEMVGIPDGLGAVKEPNGRDFTLFMNHELNATSGVVRRHGEKGAFASQLSIDKRTLEVEDGQDLVDPGVRFWNYVTQAYQGTGSPAGDNPRKPEDPANPTADDFVAQLSAFGRWCSSTLTDPGQLYNKKTGRGYNGQIYFGNEEVGNEGRSFGVTTDGQAQQLPRLGLFSWENTVAGLNKGDVTYTMGQEDAGSASAPAGQVWVYIGQKQSRGNAFDKAGLTNGLDYVLDLDNEAVSTDAGFRSTYGKNTPARFDLGPDEEIGWDQNGAQQNSEAFAEGLNLARVEDGAFDPRHPRDFYFVTTEGSPGTVPGTNPPVSRDGGGLWRITFDDVERPWKGGTLTLLLDGTEAPYLNKPDNVGMDEHGHLMIQEDPGTNAQLSRVVAYDVDTGERGVVAEFDEFQFAPGAPGFITSDEESSGIIDASKVIGSGWFLLDAQVHASAGLDNAAAQVERGQLLAMKVRSWKKVFGG